MIQTRSPLCSQIQAPFCFSEKGGSWLSSYKLCHNSPSLAIRIHVNWKLPLYTVQLEASSPRSPEEWQWVDPGIQHPKWGGSLLVSPLAPAGPPRLVDPVRLVAPRAASTPKAECAEAGRTVHRKSEIWQVVGVGESGKETHDLWEEFGSCHFSKHQVSWASANVSF